MDDRETAWAELHAANDVLGWFVGRPGPRHGGTWTMYAFDQIEKAHVGRRRREWTAEAPSEVECVYEMARVLRELREGRVPK